MREAETNCKNVKNQDLFLEYERTKDVNIRNEIFDKYKYIADIISKKYNNRGIEQEDIYQIACMALIYAIERFDLSKGFEFTSFATPTVLGEIKKYFRDKGWAIRVPRKIQEISKRVNEASSYLSAELSHMPSVSELSKYLGVSEEDVLEAFEAGKMFNSQSLDLSFDSSEDDSEATLMDMIGSEDNYFERIENKDYVKRSLDKLNKLERDIIVGRYFQSKTQNDIARILNISQMTVSRVEKKALDKLRMELNR